MEDETLTYAGIDKMCDRMQKALDEPHLTLAASGGGIGVETGNALQQFILDGAVVLPRGLVQDVVAMLRGIALAPATVADEPQHRTHGTV